MKVAFGIVLFLFLVTVLATVEGGSKSKSKESHEKKHSGEKRPGGRGPNSGKPPGRNNSNGTPPARGGPQHPPNGRQQPNGNQPSGERPQPTGPQHPPSGPQQPPSGPQHPPSGAQQPQGNQHGDGKPQPTGPQHPPNQPEHPSSGSQQPHGNQQSSERPKPSGPDHSPNQPQHQPSGSQQTHVNQHSGEKPHNEGQHQPSSTHTSSGNQQIRVESVIRRLIADSVANFLTQEGSGKLLAHLLEHRVSQKDSSFEEHGTYHDILKYLESLPKDYVCSMEKKLQYDSVIVTALESSNEKTSSSCPREEGTFQFTKFVEHLRKSGLQTYIQQHSSSEIILYIVNKLKEVSNTKDLNIAYEFLVKEITYHHKHENSKESNDSKGKPKSEKSKKSCSCDSSDSSSSSSDSSESS